MKKILLLSFLLFTLNSHTQSITRGPDIGEIYFLGPTHTTDGLYYSTDFGETAICVDSTKNFASIAADSSPGGIYCFTYPTSLYYSNNYGYSNSWEFKYAGIELSSRIEIGTELGHIFSGCNMHSEDYGVNFIYHSLNGYFGYQNRYTVDKTNDNNGYVITYKLSVGDTLYLFRTYDKFENVELINKFNYFWYEVIDLATGVNTGEVFMLNLSRNQLWVSYDYFDNLNFVDTFNIINYAGSGIEGGNVPGEFYLRYSFSNLMQQNRQLYIFHSLDYGKTFEVLHPFSKGNEPVLANFSTINKEVHITTPVEFSNFSIGDIQEYQWDFENDGTTDSYEEEPAYIYQETGWYSVRLSVVGPDSTNSFVKENYIHIIDTTTKVTTKSISSISLFPNPFENSLTISSINPTESYTISIYNLKGGKVFERYSQNTESIIINTVALNAGVYVLNISSQDNSSNYKIIKK